MLRIAHITDTHVTAPGQRLCGLDPSARLRQALASVEAADLYDAVVITGDLTNDGKPESYAEFRRCLDGLRLPVHLCVGNHDDRGNFRRAFDHEPRYGASDFVQYTVEDARGHRLVFLDTTIPGRAAGLLCARRLAWLDETLAAGPGTPTLVFLHHPPLVSHIPPLDAIGLDGIDGLAAILVRHPQVRSLHAGHVHRPMYGRLGNTPVCAATSTCHQVALDLAGSELVFTYEPPSFAMILAEGDEVLCHTVHFTETEGPRLLCPPLRNRYEPA